MTVHPFPCDLEPSHGPLADFKPPTEAAIRQWFERYAPEKAKPLADPEQPADVAAFLKGL